MLQKCRFLLCSAVFIFCNRISKRLHFEWPVLKLCYNCYYRIETHDGTSALTIWRCRRDDAAWYECTAINIAGSVTTRGKVDVHGKLIPFS